jgi:hypothetical protein
MQYGQALTKRGVPYQAVVTKLSFDYTVAHPLLKFAPARAITVEQARLIKEQLSSDVVDAILHGGNAAQTAAEVAADVAVNDEMAGAAAAAAAILDIKPEPAPTPAPAPAPTPTPQPVVSADAVAAALDETVAALAKPTRASKPRASAKAAPPTPPATPVSAAPAEMEKSLDDLLKDMDI